MPFSSDIELINKNTTVTVARSPLENGKKKVWEEEPLTGIPLQLAMAGGSGVSLNVSSMLQLSAASGVGATEDDRDHVKKNLHTLWIVPLLAKPSPPSLEKILFKWNDDITLFKSFEQKTMKLLKKNILL